MGKDGVGIESENLTEQAKGITDQHVAIPVPNDWYREARN